jgi:hypothetical protein
MMLAVSEPNASLPVVPSGWSAIGDVVVAGEGRWVAMWSEVALAASLLARTNFFVSGAVIAVRPGEYSKTLCEPCTVPTWGLCLYQPHQL